MLDETRENIARVPERICTVEDKGAFSVLAKVVQFNNELSRHACEPG